MRDTSIHIEGKWRKWDWYDQLWSTFSRDRESGITISPPLERWISPEFATTLPNTMSDSFHLLQSSFLNDNVCLSSIYASMLAEGLGEPNLIISVWIIFPLAVELHVKGAAFILHHISAFVQMQGICQRACGNVHSFLIWSKRKGILFQEYMCTSTHFQRPA